ncbi:SPFH domain-containing protein [Pseudomarimonas salicorniae]|uniref:SPFH domain-containing protein n=1 Tax=Pseudomarimonas salicorniae TaxID=2933270 RepID=A0ABT0GHY0_9GAMM|nr:SPFH domain-containing protein [Lysobacter sp. CAU 1642]MCK7594154.1 SPFH domain-containing protein [Lysobacter sp. CAU 1642]
MKEQAIRSAAGIPLLLVFIGLIVLEFWLLIGGARIAGPLLAIPAVIALIATGICMLGFYMVEPNQAAVLTLFGRYVGTVKEAGLRWNNPFYGARKVSLRVRNFESSKLKVNEADGSPIEIAAVVVWKVVDSAEAVFNVDDYESYVHVQSEAAIRAMATSYPYDQHEPDQVALRSHAAEISHDLQRQLEERLATAGIEVLEARISHLAYAPEIAHAMLQRQQANAVIAARTRIVEGAVSMVEMALENLKEKGVIELDQERRAQMVSNLLVVLCSDRATQPVVNTGTLY